MRPVDQSTFGVWGNCLPACVASLLEMPLDEVPLFHDPSSPVYVPQVVRLNAWLEPRGLRAEEATFVPFPIEQMVVDLFSADGDFYILGGMSPRRRGHVVVASRRGIVHDPHP